MHIERLARRQHGAISRRQLLGAGITRRQVDGMLASGALERVLPAVYRFGAAPDTDLTRLWAAVLHAGSDAVVSHRSAAARWNLDGVRAGLPELWSPRQVRSPGLIAHRGRVGASERGRMDGLPVTTVARTLIDLAAVVDEETLEVAIEDARRRRLPTIDRLRVPDRRQPGVGRLRAVVEALAGTAPCESALEVRVARLLRAGGVPEPGRQHAVRLGGRSYRIDFAWPGRRIGLECEGFAAHGHRAAFDRDRARLADLAAAGWRIVPVTWEHARHPTRLLTVVRAALGA